MHIYVILVSCTAPSMHIYVIPVACTAPSMHLHNIYMAQSFPSEGLVTSLRSLYFSMTEQDRATGQAEELVPIQRLSIRIQEDWWHWAYQNKWRRCDGCWTWSMLFVDFDASHTAMHQYPMTTVIERVRSVTKHDPKHMCKACNAYTLCYGGDISVVYALRRCVQILQDLIRHPLFIRHPTLMMNVARFIVDPDRVHKQRSSAPGKQ